MQQIQCISYRRATAARNMALDESLLQGLAAFSAPAGSGRPEQPSGLVRFYGWSAEAITFGYSQRWSEVGPLAETHACPAIRRSTGGGVVFHGTDLTYAIVLATKSPWYARPAGELYAALHRGIALAMQEAGLGAQLEPCAQDCEGATAAHSRTRQCFARAEPLDVTDPRSGSKLAGAAMKRDRRGLLVQGSIRLSAGMVIQHEDWVPRILRQWEEQLGVCVHQTSETGNWTWAAAEVEQLERRFGSREWNERR